MSHSCMVRAARPVVFVLLFGFWTGPAAADLAGALLESMQIGSRPDVGLGGDPFLSPCLAETGWWHHELASAVVFELRENAPITQRLSKKQGELVASEGWLSASNHHDFSAWRLGGGIMAGLRKRSHAFLDENERLAVDDEGTVAAARLDACLFRPDLRARIEFPLSEKGTRNGGWPLRYGLRGALWNRLWLSGQWRSGSYDVPCDVEAEEEFIHASLNSSEDALRASARLRLWRELFLEGSYYESIFTPHADLTTAFQDEFFPEAQLYVRQISLEWRGLASCYDLLMRRSICDFYGSGAGCWGGQRYLRLSNGRGALDADLLALQRHIGRARLLAEVELSDFSGFGRADIEGWRFGSSDFLGGKKVIQGGGDGVLRRYHLAGEVKRAWGRLRGGLTWYEINPDLEIESWIKIVIVRDDYEHRRLASDRYSLAALSIGGDTTWFGVRVGLGLHQFVYFDDHRRGTGGEPSEGQENQPSGWYGGSFFDLRVSRQF